MLGESKVRNLDVTVGTEKNVLGLEITVNDVEGVKVVEGKGNLSGEELGDGIREALMEVKGGSVKEWRRRRGGSDEPDSCEGGRRARRPRRSP